MPAKRTLKGYSKMNEKAKELVELMIAKGLTAATAESCTGGGVAHAITSIPGSSAVFMGGVVSYANEVKERVLGVCPETLAVVGAVSSETAAQMVEGVRELMKVDLAVSLTGIAGPDGGSVLKPVGTVWFGCATRESTKTEMKVFSGNREEVRAAAIDHALGLLIKLAKGEVK